MFKAVIDGNDGFFDEVRGVNLNLWGCESKSHAGDSGRELYSSRGSKIWKCTNHERALAIDSQQSLLYMKNWKGDTALHIVARLGHFDMTKLLITCAND